MLKIYLGNMEKAIYHPPTYFDNQYEDEWITKELSIDCVKYTSFTIFFRDLKNPKT